MIVSVLGAMPMSPMSPSLPLLTKPLSPSHDCLHQHQHQPPSCRHNKLYILSFNEAGIKFLDKNDKLKPKKHLKFRINCKVDNLFANLNFIVI